LSYLKYDQGKPGDKPWLFRIANASGVSVNIATEETLLAVKTAIEGIGGVGGGGVASSVSVSNFPATQPVSVATLPLPTGAATQTTLASVLAALQGTVAVSVSNLPGTQPISAATLPLPSGAATQTTLASVLSALQGTVAVSGPLTDAQLRAAAVPVSVGNFPASQAVTGPLTDAQLRALAVPVSAAALPLPTGAAQDSTLTSGSQKTKLVDSGGANVASVSAAGALKVDGSAATQPVSIAATVAISAASLPLPSGAAQEHTTAAAPHAVRLTDGTSFFKPTTPADTQPVSGPLTDTQLRASAVPVSAAALPLPTGAAQDSTLTSGSQKTKLVDSGGTNAASVSAAGALKVDGSAVTQPVSAAALPLPSGASQEHTTAVSPHAVRLTDGTAFFKPTTPSDTQPVSIAATVPVSGPLTDTQLRASAVPVSAASLPLPTGAATAAKQPALGTAGTPSADVLTVQGAASMTALKVDGSATTQPVAGTITVQQATAANLKGLMLLADQAAASNNTTGVVSLGNSLGKTAAMQTNSLITTAVTADQVIKAYTVPAGKTFYLQYIDFFVRLTTFAATATYFGTAYLQQQGASNLYISPMAGTGVAVAHLELTEPMPFAAGTVLRALTTPSATTSMTWNANFGGYEK
jgi:hypothetical protein